MRLYLLLSVMLPCFWVEVGRAAAQQATKKETPRSPSAIHNAVVGCGAAFCLRRELSVISSVLAYLLPVVS